jgi:hypothetical protein
VINLSAYEVTAVDWNALRYLALRAAQQTPLPPAPQIVYCDRDSLRNVKVVGPHWVLDHRMRNTRGTYGDRIEEDHTEDVYALLPDGQLVYLK